jgi:hypothetical protein
MEQQVIDNLIQMFCSTDDEDVKLASSILESFKFEGKNQFRKKYRLKNQIGKNILEKQIQPLSTDNYWILKPSIIYVNRKKFGRKDDTRVVDVAKEFRNRMIIPPFKFEGKVLFRIKHGDKGPFPL